MTLSRPGGPDLSLPAARDWRSGIQQAADWGSGRPSHIGALSFVELEMKAAGIVTYGTDLDNPDFAEIAPGRGPLNWCA
jgi:hypothetical protein